MARLLWLGLVVCLGTIQGTAQEPDARLIDRIRAKVAQTLARQPDYTCRLQIFRAQREPGGERFFMLDSIRLEVALIEGKEMFSWPGAGRFESQDLGEFISAGALSSGSFALHLRNVFLSGGVSFQHKGEETLNGRSTQRFVFQVPREVSDYVLRFGDQAEVMPLAGSFWADASTREVVRLEIKAVEIPSSFSIIMVSEAIEYTDMAIGEGRFRLPTMVESVVIGKGGGALRNRTEYSECHQYTGESSISFGHTTPETDEPDLPVEEFDLPPGAKLELAFGLALDIAGLATGDQLVAFVQKDVMGGGRILVPKGATVHGRLQRLIAIPGKPNYYLVFLDFDRLEFDNKKARIAGQLEYINYRAGTTLRISGQPMFDDSAIPVWARDASRACGGSFYVYGHPAALRLPPGAVFRWKTVQNPEDCAK